MDISLILKVSGVGFLVACACFVLTRAGREEHASFVSLAGVIIVLLLLAQEIGKLFSAVRNVFGL